MRASVQAKENEKQSYKSALMGGVGANNNGATTNMKRQNKTHLARKNTAKNQNSDASKK